MNIEHDDLVVRLREAADDPFNNSRMAVDWIDAFSGALLDAADEIERLRGRVHPANNDFIALPSDSKISDFASDQAGCGGHVYFNVMTGEIWLCDASNLILWKDILPGLEELDNE